MKPAAAADAIPQRGLPRAIATNATIAAPRAATTTVSIPGSVTGR